MKPQRIFPLLSLLLALAWGAATAQPSNDMALDGQLAQQYFQNNEFDKAAVLYESLFERTQSRVYFNYYLECLLKLEQHREAERAVKAQIRKNPQDLGYLVMLGKVLAAQGLDDQAQEQYEEAIRKMDGSLAQTTQLANAFLMEQKYDMAERIYLVARSKNADYPFHFELASVYAMQRDDAAMIKEYLDFLAKDHTRLSDIQTRLQYPIVNDPTGDLKRTLRMELLRRLQERGRSEETQNAFSELLIWLYTQDKDFENAMVQAEAIDRRNQENGFRLMSLGELALSNRDYAAAYRAFDYVAAKGSSTFYHNVARYKLLNVLYQQVASGLIQTQAEIQDLERRYATTIGELGRTVPLLRDLARLKAFHLQKPQEGMDLLQQAIGMPGIQADEKAQCQVELADIQLYLGDIWGAKLLYWQVEKQNEESPIGHEAKFKNARTSYYDGDFELAQAQLDILKSSTSKLIANDAFYLSQLIKDNLGQDSINTPLRKFAAAELLFLQNRPQQALDSLDAILERFPTSLLVDDIYFQKAKIHQRQRQFDLALGFYQKIAESFAQDLLGDDAIFAMAEINEFDTRDLEKAMEHYKRLIVEFPGSIYTEQARDRYRQLRGDFQ